MSELEVIRFPKPPERKRFDDPFEDSISRRLGYSDFESLADVEKERINRAIERAETALTEELGPEHGRTPSVDRVADCWSQLLIEDELAQGTIVQ